MRVSNLPRILQLQFAITLLLASSLLVGSALAGDAADHHAHYGISQPPSYYDASDEAPNATVHVSMADSFFNPSDITITVGDTISWRNYGHYNHNVNSTSDEPFSSGNMGPGVVFTHTFNVVGDFSYQCTYHYAEGMLGVVHVVSVNPTPTGSPADVTATPAPATDTPAATPTATAAAAATSAMTDTPPSTATSTPAPPTATPLPTETPVTTPPPATNTPLPAPTDCANSFVDVIGNVFYNAIHSLNCNGVVSGSNTTHYQPAGISTRAQFAKVVVLGFSLSLYTPASVQSDFSDVPPTYFAYAYIESGLQAGILDGYPAAQCQAAGASFPCYLPNRPITRAELTILVVRAASYPLVTPGGQSFSDVPPASFAYLYVETAHARNVINGYSDGSFRPNNYIRRDEMAQIVYSGVTTP